MSGVESPRARSLRPGDPTELGRYRITGRLGEGGMGSVYLASIDILNEFYYKAGALLEPGSRTQIAIKIQGDAIALYRDGELAGSWADQRFSQGRVVLGVFGYAAGSPAPYAAIFHRVQVFQPPPSN